MTKMNISIHLNLKFFAFGIFFFLGLILFGNSDRVDAQGSGPEGMYTYDILNFIYFHDGQFSEQYVTDKYEPDISQIGEGEPAGQRETLCRAKGEYVVNQSVVFIEYKADLCQIKEEIDEAIYDPDADTITIDGRTYGKVEDKTPKMRSDEGTKQDGELRWKAKEKSNPNKLLKDISDDDLGAYDHETLGGPSPSPSSFDQVRVLSDSSDTSAGHAVWKWHVGNAMKKLNNTIGGIWYCPSGYNLRLSSSYWTWTDSVGDGGWIPRYGVSPADAVNWYFGDITSPSEACTECLMAARACFYKGLLDTIGKTAFDNWFQYCREDLVVSYKSRAPSDLTMTKVIASENDLSRGDWVYFQNWVTGANCPAINPLQGENAITQNYSDARTYIGLGIPARSNPPQPAVSGDDILNELNQAWLNTSCPKERELGLNKNTSTASATYFANFSSLVTPLQNSVSITGVSGAKGSMNQFKIVVPSTVSSISISTSGGWGDTDLYIKKAFWATRSIYDAVSNNDGNNEGLTGEGNVVGVFYVMLYGYADFGGVTLVATYQNSSEPVPWIKANGYSGSITVSKGTPVSITMGLDAGGWQGYTVDWWVLAHGKFVLTESCFDD